MNSNHNCAGFRIRSIQRKISNPCALVKSNSLTQPRLVRTQTFDYQVKHATHPPVINEDSSPNSGKKQLFKRIIPKKLYYPLALIDKNLDDKDNKPQQQTLLPIPVANRVCYNEIVKQSDSDDEEQKVNYKFGFWPKEGRVVFMKEIRPSRKRCLEERVAGLKHKGLVEYLGVEKVGNVTCFISQFMGCGSLSERLEHLDQPLNENLVKRYTREIVEIVKYLHSKNYVHGNITPSKMLITQTGELKLSLISSLEQEPISSGSDIKKILWSSPETIMYDRIQKAGDIWSIGMMVMQMVTQQKPWCFKAWESFKNTVDLMRIIETYQVPKLPEDCDKDLREFLEMCLKFSPKDRGSIQELSQSRFLAPL